MGILVALLGGILSGWLMSLFRKVGSQPACSGLGITLLMTALALFGFRVIFGENRVLPSIQPFKQLNLFNENPYWVRSFHIYADLHRYRTDPHCLWIVFRTNFGLNLRSVGDNPEATDAAGINVYRLRTIALVMAGR